MNAQHPPSTHRHSARNTMAGAPAQLGGCAARYGKACHGAAERPAISWIETAAGHARCRREVPLLAGFENNARVPPVAAISRI